MQVKHRHLRIRGRKNVQDKASGTDTSPFVNVSNDKLHGASCYSYDRITYNTQHTFHPCTNSIINHDTDTFSYTNAKAISTPKAS
jgi:hypothetical protein